MLRRDDGDGVRPLRKGNERGPNYPDTLKECRANGSSRVFEAWSGEDTHVVTTRDELSGNSENRWDIPTTLKHREEKLLR